MGIFRHPPQPFIGGRQPLAPRKIAALLVPPATVDDPPFAGWRLTIIEWPESNAYWLPRRYLPLVVEGGAASGDLSSTGEGTAIFAGASTAASDLSSTGTATVTWIGASLAASAWSVTGEATVTWNSASTAGADWSVTAQAVVTLATASLASGDWSSVGVSTVTWNGQSFAASELSSDAVSTAIFTTDAISDPPVGYRPWLRGVIESWIEPHNVIWTSGFTIPAAEVADGTISSIGVATATFTGSSFSASDFYTIGTATVTFVSDVAVEAVPRGRPRQDTIVALWQQNLIPLWGIEPTIQGIDNPPFGLKQWLYPVLRAWQPVTIRIAARKFVVQVGVATEDGAFSSVGLGVATFTGQSTGASPISSDGSATLIAVGASLSEAPISAAGTSTLIALGASVVSSPITSIGEATAIFVGAELAENSGAFSASGTSTAIFSASSTASADMDANGTSDAEFTSTAAVTTRHEGRRRRRRELEQEDEEIMAIIRELAPYVMRHKRTLH